MKVIRPMSRLGVVSLICLVFFLCCPARAKGAVVQNSESPSESITEDAPGTGDDRAEGSQSKSKEKKAPQVPETTRLNSSMATPTDEEAPHVGVLPAPQTHVFTGAATTSVPIRVPPGRAGLAPSLALSYNSFQKNGWIGLGWGLDIGAIQRSTKRGLSLDQNDHYDQGDYVAQVGGNSVELVPRTDWGPGCFGAKIEGQFSKFKFTGVSWKVIAKDGKKYFYGTSESSRQSNVHGTFKWCLDKVKDTNGNFIAIDYEKDQGEIYLKKIRYTGNEDSQHPLDPTNRVRFYVEDRPDDPPAFTTNAKVVTAKRLKTIYVTALSATGYTETVRAYLLSYGQSEETGQSYLSTVQEYGSDVNIDEATGDVTGGSTLPPIRVMYTPEVSQQKEEYFWGANRCQFANSPPTFGFADFNGDGRTDFLYRKDGRRQLRVLLSTGTGFGRDTKWGTFNKSADPQEPNQAYADFNGDGMADFAYRKNHYNRWKIKLSNGSGFDAETKWGDYAYAPHEDEDGHRLYTFADFNGDGKTDFAYRRRYTKEIRVLLARETGDGFEPDTLWGAFDHPVADDPPKFAFADFNGDGKTDLIYRRDNTRELHVLLSRPEGDGFQDEDYTWGEYEYDHATDAPRFGFADFNGDGKTDFLYRVRYTQELRLLLSKGYTSEETSWGTYAHGDVENNAPKVAYADFNGDGKADFMYRRLNQEKWLLKLSNGKGFEPETEWGTRLEQVDPDSPSFGFADFTGDGKTDFLYRQNHTKNWHVMESDETPFVLVSRLENQMGGSAEIAYSPSSSYKNTNLPYVVQTVSQISVNDDNGNLSLTDYTYEDGLFDFPSREFRGFGIAEQTNPDATTVKTWFHQDEYFKGREHQVDLREPNSGPLLVRTTQLWGKEPVEGASQFVRLDRKLTFYDGDSSDYFTRADYTYTDDNQDNMWEKVTVATSGTAAETITSTKQYIDCGDWIWRPERERLEGSVSGQVRGTDYAYDGKGNLLTKILWLNGASAQPEIEMTYDSYGNVVTAKDPEQNITTTAYDSAKHTYPVKITYPETNGVVHDLEYEFDYRFGKAKYTWDKNNNRTDYFYDTFGRPSRTLYPPAPGENHGGETLFEYHDYDDQHPDDPVYVVTRICESKDASGECVSFADKYEYSDGLGRTIQTITSGDETGKSLDDPNCHSVVSWMEYDERGRNYWAHGPVHSTGVGLKPIPQGAHPNVVTLYDFRGRPRIFAGPDDTGTPLAIQTNISYTGFTTTVTDPDGKKKKEERDHLGRVREVTVDPDGQNTTTSYEYNAAGDLLTVTVKDAAGHELSRTVMSYDTLGRKTRMTDPDMGVWKYVYDNNGNMASQSDPNGCTITFQYDELNRVVSKTYTTSGDPVSYVYDQASENGVGRLHSVTKGSLQNPVAKTTYEAYDALGRATRIVRSVEGTPYETTYQYDLSGKTTQITYPAESLVVNYEYYSGTGLLRRVYNTNVNFATFTNYPPTGKVRDVLYGNGVRTTYEYYNSTARLDSIFTYKGSQSFQYKDYQYTDAGNVSYLVDANDLSDPGDDLSYEYEYDGLHRLISEKINGADSVDYAYDDTGNIMSKTIGATRIEYSDYDDTKKHAVKQIKLYENDMPQGTFDYIYDDNGNMTSGHDFTDTGSVVQRSIGWSADNMPTTISQGDTTTNFVYDGDGMRVKKSVVGGTSTEYVGEHYEITDGSATSFIFAAGTRVAMVADVGTVTYFHKDHLGSSTVMTNETGAQSESTGYLPYGGERYHAGQNMTGYKFTDQELDPSTGLYNYNARLYDPIIGRFISPDTIVQDPYDPQMLNRYSYARNNPLIYTDPSGHILGVDDAIRAGVGAAVGGAMAAVTGENIMEGMFTGAISGVCFGWAGDIIRTAEITSHMAQSGIHVATGAVTGGINSTITAGDVGMGMVTGGISAGIAKYGGLKLFSEGGLLAGTMAGISNEYAKHGVQLLAYSAMGGVSGGISAELYGGHFGDGFVHGAKMAAYGYLFNWTGEKMVMGIKTAVVQGVKGAAYSLNRGAHDGLKSAHQALGDLDSQVIEGTPRRVMGAAKVGLSVLGATVSINAARTPGASRYATAGLTASTKVFADGLYEVFTGEKAPSTWPIIKAPF